MRNVAYEAPVSRADRIAPDGAESIMSIANLPGDSFRSAAMKHRLNRLSQPLSGLLHQCGTAHVRRYFLQGYGNIRTLHLDATNASSTRLIISHMGLWHVSAHAV